MEQPVRRRNGWRIAGGIAAGLALALAILVAIALWVSPRPGVLVIRSLFDKGAADASAALEKHVPPGIRSQLGVVYDPAHPDARLDIYRPARPVAGAPTIVWVHGGGFVSGRREDVANYLKVLAGEGFTTVSVDYTIAPEATYPTPIRQVNAALGFLSREGAALGIDPNRLIIAGDSAGAGIAAQISNLVSNPDYARAVGIRPAIRPDQLRGALLFCGIYDLAGIGRDGGLVGWFINTAGWAYNGKRSWRDDPRFALNSVAQHLGSRFPPSFITAGNADPLGPQSVALAKALEAKGHTVVTRFFPQDHQPALGHEYQFNLDGRDGQQTLRDTVAFARTAGA